MKSCGMSVIKYILFAFNFVFAVSSFGYRFAVVFFPLKNVFLDFHQHKIENTVQFFFEGKWTRENNNKCVGNERAFKWS